MAPQGGLGWPKDPATAPHEELREAALSCCPKLISLDSNKMAPIFICFWFFGEGGGTYWMGGVGRGDRSKQPLAEGERKEKYVAKTGRSPLVSSAPAPPCSVPFYVMEERGINDLQSLFQF